MKNKKIDYISRAVIKDFLWLLLPSLCFQSGNVTAANNYPLWEQSKITTITPLLKSTALLLSRCRCNWGKPSILRHFYKKAFANISSFDDQAGRDNLTQKICFRRQVINFYQTQTQAIISSLDDDNCTQCPPEIRADVQNLLLHY